MNWWSISGLILDGLGVLVLLFWPPPAEPMLKDGGEVMGLRDVLPAKDKEQNKRRWTKQQRNARVGLFLVLLGFGLQLVGQFVGGSPSHGQ